MAKQLRRDIRALLLVPTTDLAIQVDERMQRLGFPALRPAQSQLLTLVQDEGKRLTQLVDAMRLPKQTLGDMIDELERLKLVERYQDPDHGVIKRVRLAARGRAWAAEVRKVAALTEARWATALGKTKLKTLRGLLEELTARLDGDDGKPGKPGRPNGKR